MNRIELAHELERLSLVAIRHGDACGPFAVASQLRPIATRLRRPTPPWFLAGLVKRFRSPSYPPGQTRNSHPQTGTKPVRGQK
jgi:hypothetical protein